MRHLLVLLLASALAGCAASKRPDAGPAGSTGGSTASLELSGTLTRKGPDESSFWAVTDATGRVRELVDVPPDLEARLRRLQNGPVTLRVEPRVPSSSLLEQFRVLEILRPTP